MLQSKILESNTAKDLNDLINDYLKTLGLHVQVVSVNYQTTVHPNDYILYSALLLI